MVKIIRIFVVMTLLLVTMAAPASAKGPDHQVPIKGTVLGEHWEPDFTDEDCIAAGYVWRFNSAGEGGVGQISHLGRVADYSLTQCTIPGPDGTLSEGTITFTAANGDELWVEHTMLGQIIGVFPGGQLDGFTFEGEWTAVGGTGRFASAMGSGILYGAGDVPDGVAFFDGIPDGLMQLNIEGTIAYKRK